MPRNQCSPSLSWARGESRRPFSRLYMNFLTDFVLVNLDIMLFSSQQPHQLGHYLPDFFTMFCSLKPIIFRNDPNKGNCPPGSVIDSEITHPTVSDFYLQSHGAIQGSKYTYFLLYCDLMPIVLLLASRSSHYIVLKDDNFNFNLQV